jgi:glycosyltransferase involved in cell wall biosynthesis
MKKCNVAKKDGYKILVPEEFINESNGILVPANDVDALAEAMTKMHDTYDSYDRTAIAKECLCKFSPSVIAKQLTSIFEEVAG